MNPNILNVINQKNLRIRKMSSRVNISNHSIKKKQTKLTLGPGSPDLPGLPRFPGQPCEKTGHFFIKWSDEGMIWSATERWSVFRPSENKKPLLGNKALLTFIATDLFFLSLSNLLVRYSGYSHYCLVLIITTRNPYRLYVWYVLFTPQWVFLRYVIPNLLAFICSCVFHDIDKYQSLDNISNWFLERVSVTTHWIVSRCIVL